VHCFRLLPPRKGFLHSLREGDAQEGHRVAQGAGQGVDEGQAELEYGLVLFLEDGGVVVVLVKLLGQVVGIIGDDCPSPVPAETSPNRRCRG